MSLKTVGVPKEIKTQEYRVAMTPDSALQLQKLGFDCVIESGAGQLAGFFINPPEIDKEGFCLQIIGITGEDEQVFSLGIGNFIEG